MSQLLTLIYGIIINLIKFILLCSQLAADDINKRVVQLDGETLTPEDLIDIGTLKAKAQVHILVYISCWFTKKY